MSFIDKQLLFAHALESLKQPNIKINRILLQYLSSHYNNFPLSKENCATILPILDKLLLNSLADIKQLSLNVLKMLVSSFSIDILTQMKNLKQTQI